MNSFASQATSPLIRIVIAQFCCTSVWFAGNAALNGMLAEFDLRGMQIGRIASAVQFGFIIGTLCFAILAVADRYSPSKVFGVAALVAALSNAAIIYLGDSLTGLLTCRVITGFALAGIYPVGMKIAADYYDRGLGRSLGYLVGALVVGTAFSQLVASFFGEQNWRQIIWITSALAIFGGALIGFGVQDGPYRRAGQQVSVTGFFQVFHHRPLRRAAFGYFGHMWELYTFWTFVPLLLISHNQIHGGEIQVSLWSFIIIAVGAFGCVLGGYLSEHLGLQRTAMSSLLISGTCCLLCPFMIWYAPPFPWLTFLLIWGFTVIADSPLFSTLVAQSAPTEQKATALTIVNCLGFALTIVSIELIQEMRLYITTMVAIPILALGPLLGWWFGRIQDSPTAQE